MDPTLAFIFAVLCGGMSIKMYIANSVYLWPFFAIACWVFTVISVLLCSDNSRDNTEEY